MRTRACLVLLAVLASGCAQQGVPARPSGSPVTTGSPAGQGAPVTSGSLAPVSSATAGGSRPGEVLIVVAETPYDRPGSLTLYRPDGKEVAHFPLEPATTVLAVAGSRVFVRGQNDRLRAVRRDGTVEDLGSVGARWFAANPDGTRWIWGTAETDSDTTHSAVHLGGDGLTARVVEETTQSGRLLAPILWTRQAAFVQYAPSGGHGGYFPFGRQNEWLLVEGAVHKLDPMTGRITPLPATEECIFGDVAADGTIVCLPGGPNVRLVSPGGRANTIPLATPRFNIVDAAFCAPVESVCTVAGATGVGSAMAYPDNPQSEQYGTDLVTTDGSIRRFGPDGTFPAMNAQSWLPDGSLVLQRRNPPGLYVLDRSGHGPFFEISGEAVGYLD